MDAEYIRSTAVAEACRLAAAEGAALLAGGTDLLVELKGGTRQARSLISLRDLEDLKGFRRGPDGRYFLGAMTSHAEVARHPVLQRVFPALADACGEVGSEAVRAAGTIGGNLCTAAPSADSAGPLLAYGAEALIARAGAGYAGDRVLERRLPLADFLLGPRQVALAPGDLLVGFALPDPGAHGARYEKFARRKALDIATVAVTALVRLDESGRIESLTLALGAVAPTPILVPAAAAAAGGREPSDALLREVAAAAVAAAAPIDDIRAGADYRSHLVDVLSRRAVYAAWENARGLPEGLCTAATTDERDTEEAGGR